jgi:hypothetical protein
MAHFDDSSKADSISRSQDLEDEDLGTTSGSEGDDLETVKGRDAPPPPPPPPPPAAASAVSSSEYAREIREIVAEALAAMPPKKSRASKVKKPKGSTKKKTGSKQKTVVKQNKAYKKLAAAMHKVGA